MKSYGKFRDCIREGIHLICNSICRSPCLLEKEALLEKILVVFKFINSRFHQHHIDELGYMGFYESFASILNDVSAKSQKIEEIPLYLWYDCVAYLRLVVSCEIKSNPNKYQPHNCGDRC